MGYEGAFKLPQQVQAEPSWQMGFGIYRSKMQPPFS